MIINNYTVLFYSAETDNRGAGKPLAISLKAESVVAAVGTAIERAERDFGPVTGIHNISVQDAIGDMVVLDLNCHAIYASARRWGS